MSLSNGEGPSFRARPWLPAQLRYPSDFDFREFVLELLSLQAQSEYRSVETDYRLPGLPDDFVPDLFAPQGLAGIEGPLWVEVRYRQDFDPEWVEGVAGTMAAAAVAGGVRSILIIGDFALAEADRAWLGRWKAREDLRVFVWGRDELRPLVQRFVGKLRQVPPGLIGYAVDQVVKSSIQTPELWKEWRAQYLAELKASFREDDLVLFLGAGVSKEAGVPDWNSLLYRLFVRMVEFKVGPEIDLSTQERAFLAQALQQFHGSSPLLAARYLQAGFEQGISQQVSALLYEDRTTGVGRDSLLLAALARLCTPRRDGPGVKAVVTFNFDDLLERSLAAAGVQHRSIYRDEDVAGRGQLGVFHVHGFIPRKPEDYEGVLQQPLVLSEEEYHTLSLDPYLWSNIVQLNFLRDSRCLLVGLSVTDPNLRRLLDIASRKNRKKKHYVILKRVTADEILEHLEGGRKELRPNVLETFLSIHHSLQESSFSRLNLNVLWVEAHAEIPALIRQITD